VCRGACEDQNVTPVTEPEERGKDAAPGVCQHRLERGALGGEAVRFTAMRSWAPQVRTSALAGWPTLWTRAWASFPPAAVYGRPMTSHSPVSSERRSPI